MFDWTTLLIAAIEILVVVNVLMVGVAGMTWVERRLSAVIQFRWGPNRVGPAGLLQPIADGIKFLWKEEMLPRDAYMPVFILAPALAMVTSIFAFSVIPFGPTIRLFGRSIDLVLLDMNGGILFAFAATSIGVYAIVCAGWASRSKYALIGGLRSSAQMISYELTLGLSVIGVIIASGTLRPTVIVEQQAGWFWSWNMLGGGQLLGFLLFVIAGFAETNRLPFDLPEAESELVAGYHTEYSSMKFSMFFMAEYIAMITMSALATTLFLGGYNPGFPPEAIGLSDGWPLWILQLFSFVVKVGLFMFFFVWVRWTLPRFRYDQLMDLGWKRLFPLALFNIFLTGFLVAFDVI
ncbi:MAG TPA: NADH-quinone oxidoreductase subunit NuoH [Candidatus Polarisedimenticolaceae bacterium]|nr:NADH-quinone oxidoreductase subunit NuoH [Candidatus Polarisedimenticolaceae bacterium]